MKKLILTVLPCLFFASLYAQIKVVTDGSLEVNTYGTVHVSQTITTGDASGFDFNTASTIPGFLFEQDRSESSGFYCDGDIVAIYSPGDRDRLLRMYDSDAGMVEKWYLDGNGNAYTISDERSKKNITDIQNSLSLLITLKAKKYNYIGNDKEKYGKAEENKFDSSQKQYYGFLAQDVEKVFPNVVSEDEDGNKFVCYTQLIPVIIEGVQEQQETIDQQQEEIDLLKAQVEDLATKLSALISAK
ncbi:tail fiber domain-containing protein [Mangrovibacterium diazotrophicum]|uniref:Endosialidase-like protein n=1 Tax=Mangrovibacterium diazotrophicum TaxID=1261403 RepID=A0A419WB62_9BACT|nr:tail fiber domain-containing protein [Mangrovibacterium diazotrophicum]RKD92652.1 endosialidase-like protein [Mangrovibacterium diazotrophicum]